MQRELARAQTPAPDEAALKAAAVPVEVHTYAGTQHGFHNNSTPRYVEAAAKLIRDGELVALPTETVYGLGADATNERAVAKIFEAKGRPKFNPLISHVSNSYR